MRILLIMPDAHMHVLRLGRFRKSLREMPLTLATLAALAPSDPSISIRLVDGSVEDVPLDDPADLVGVSVLTGCANQAYALADRYRAHGATTVLGGVHVSNLPGEAAAHADAIVLGNAEVTWPRVIEDFRHDRLRRVYREPLPQQTVLTGVPTPRWDLHRTWRYMIPYAVQATRGCRRACDFCSVPTMWKPFMRRPVGDVIRDVRQTRSRHIAFNDVSLTDDAEYARELFSALIPLRKRWGGLATVDLLRDPDLLELMVRSGCRYLLFGFESDNPGVLSSIHKGFNRSVDYAELMRVMHDHGISVQGCFVFGFDDDDRSVFARTVERVHDLRIDIPRYSIYTAYPGTELYFRLLEEKRITSFNWDDYDTMHVVHEPARMTADELYAGFKWAYRQTFTSRSILHRIQGRGINTAVNFVGNLTYRLFVRRLESEPRFAQPCSRLAPGTPPAPEHYARAFAEEALCAT